MKAAAEITLYSNEKERPMEIEHQENNHLEATEVEEVSRTLQGIKRRPSTKCTCASLFSSHLGYTLVLRFKQACPWWRESAALLTVAAWCVYSSFVVHGSREERILGSWYVWHL